MSSLRKGATKLAPIVNALWYQFVLVFVMLAQLMFRHQALVILAMVMIFVYFGVQMLTQDLTKRQRILYTVILTLNAATVLALAWATAMA